MNFVGIRNPSGLMLVMFRWCNRQGWVSNVKAMRADVGPFGKLTIGMLWKRLNASGPLGPTVSPYKASLFLLCKVTLRKLVLFIEILLADRTRLILVSLFRCR